MQVSPLKTKKIIDGDHLFSIIDQFLPLIKEGSILAVTSKIVAICEGNTFDRDQKDLSALIKEEADNYLETDAPYVLTIKNNILIPQAGIDESNSDGRFVLWPRDPFQSAREIREYVVNKKPLKDFGVIITDSKTSPLRHGTTGISIAHAGFTALKDYRGKEDLFGRKLKVTLADQADALASGAVLVMGEGAEQTPMALIGDLEFIKFDADAPTAGEKQDQKISIEEDLYGPLLRAVTWIKKQDPVD